MTASFALRFSLSFRFTAAFVIGLSLLTATSDRLYARSLGETASLRVDRYATTERLTRDLAKALGLDTNPVAVERLHLGVAHLLDTDASATLHPDKANISTLPQLTARHTREMQRWLASWLPEPAYDRYVALLDKFRVKAN